MNLNGPALAAFMEGFQRTKAQMAAQQRGTMQDDLALQDRQRLIMRQTDQDRIAAEDRQRQQALQVPQIGQSLAQAGGMSETPEGAEQAIDALFRIMAPSLGGVEQLGGVRDTAILQAGRTITARQKKDVERFVDQALKTSFVADNPEADPEITNLPEHIQKIVGKPSAKLSELQTYAQMPVGKPQGKTRTPPAAGSLEEYADPATSPERRTEIEGLRKRYMQSDDQPRGLMGGMNASPQDVNDVAQQLVDGNLVPSMLMKRGNYNEILAAANRLARAQTGKPYNATRAQTEFGSAQRFASSMNSQQQQRFRALAVSVVNTIDEVRLLADALKNSGIPIVNKAKLAAYIQTAGNSEMGQKASQYLAAVNTLKEEFANLANGGYAPTEAAWALANSQINGNYGVQQLNASLTEVQRLINFRLQAFDALVPY